ncbi:MAG: ATP-binding protein [Gammaproteobacteria bacterium]|nr:ATP-binding protein [Gammaproteobacteria bacterium]MDD9886086.1 ATP-binding protein [Gammaproteobacteria bacterium]
MAEDALYSRHVEQHLIEALEDSPVVLIHGARQCGKTTLARMVGTPRDYAYINFDDNIVRDAAQMDPAGFVANLPERIILDEVQRAPALFTALKLEVDRRRVPGRFLLTGSTSILLLSNLSDSLAGRMQILRLHPFAQRELEQPPQAPGFLDCLFKGEFRLPQKPLAPESSGASSAAAGNGELAKRVVTGGYPAALARPAGRRRSAWCRDYLDALVQRDVRDLTRIRSLEALPQLLTLAATQTARLLNVTDLASTFESSRPTIRSYVTLLERLFILDRLPPWHSNRLSRIVKTPKLHLGDTGLACALLGVDAAALMADRPLFGQLLETFVFQELRRQASWQDAALAFFHYRDKDKVEVDIVIERGARVLAGVEVKAAATVTAADFRGLRKLKRATGKRFAGGAVLYNGEISASFGGGLYAVPIRALWGVE